MMNFQYGEWETQIEAYLHNKLQPAEKWQFEQLMQQNPALKAAVEFDEILKEKAEIIALTKYAHQNWDALNAKATQMHWIRLLKWGLACATIIGVSWWGGSKYWAQRTIQNWLVVHLQPLELTDDAFETEKPESKALKAYQMKQFEVAEALFMQQDSGQNNYSFMRLYRAINALCVQPPHTQQAIEILELRYQEEHHYKLQAVKWYLFLAYLQHHEWKKARKVAERIPKESPYFERVQTVLPKIPN